MMREVQPKFFLLLLSFLVMGCAATMKTVFPETN